MNSHVWLLFVVPSYNRSRYRKIRYEYKWDNLCYRYCYVCTIPFICLHMVNIMRCRSLLSSYMLTVDLMATFSQWKKKTFHKNCIIIWFSLAEVKLLVSISKALLLIKGIYLISMLGIWLCFPIIPLVDRSIVFVIFHRLFPFWIYLGEEMVYMIAVRQHSNRLNHITLYIATVHV